ncbi:hypothetical protein GCM10023172_13410 [Hymenobacter ginsengisoli]|uniref:Uncharacterized protein n=1 Tax=Hymenobacter ginsengisoli TaxID=1051626 RepID=A0ABP8Q8B8_9BACT|nr:MULTISPECIES: hypothetical protein [unclassified Hymenobacter]MBO2033583.1 hypothetical protein [Hymenobacter sp. BT559]
MVRIALFACLLGLLVPAAPATAAPSHASWPFWLSQPERHGQRKLPGDYTHINKTYRNHSRNDGEGLFSFLHSGNRRSALARHQNRPHPHRGGRKHTSGIF